MTIQTSTNCRIHIGTTAEADTLTEYEADTYVEVGEVEDLGEFGDESSIVTFAALNDGRMRKLKGIKDAGDMALVVAMDGDDEGQAALVAAEKDSTSVGYNVKIELNDKGTTNATTFFFRAQVTSNRLAIGAADNVIRRNVTLAITSEILEKAAA